jgi:tetratricopeptide (TPR) repeat protein
VRPLAAMFPKGNKKRGIEELLACVEKGRYAKTEALYFLLQIYYVYERDFVKATEYSKKLHEKYPNNSFFYTYLGRTYAASGFWSEAETIYTDVMKKRVAGEKNYNDRHRREAHYYLGLALMNKKQHAEALEHFKKSYEYSQKVDGNEPSAYQPLSVLRIGMIQDAQGNRIEALNQYKKVLTMKDIQNSHKMAQSYINHAYSG